MLRTMISSRKLLLIVRYFIIFKLSLHGFNCGCNQTHSGLNYLDISQCLFSISYQQIIHLLQPHTLITSNFSPKQWWCHIALQMIQHPTLTNWVSTFSYPLQEPAILNTNFHPLWIKFNTSTPFTPYRNNFTQTFQILSTILRLFHQLRTSTSYVLINFQTFHPSFQLLEYSVITFYIEISRSKLSQLWINSLMFRQSTIFWTSPFFNFRPTYIISPAFAS